MERVKEIYKLVTTFCKRWNIFSEDVIQDLVMAVHSRLDKFDSQKANFTTFVFMNCKNYYLMSIAKKEHYTVSYDDVENEFGEFIDTSNTPSENVLEQERNNLVSFIYNNVCSDHLKDYLQGIKQKDIAKKYNIPYSTLNQIISRELVKLKETYGE